MKCLKGSSQSVLEVSHSARSELIADAAQVTYVEWNILVLRHQNNLLAECVAYAKLIEDVWIVICQIGDYVPG